MSANFDPTMGNYKNMTPFKMWCQKVLPQTYDDSLSYYEVLCKLKNHLNEVIENMDVLHDDVDALHVAYQQLESYVNDYFDNLSVQTEINNKLDDMAEDGSLSELIAPFVETLLPEEVADRIESVVALQLGAVVAQQLGAVVGEQLPNEVATQVPTMVSAWLNEHVNPESEVVIDDSLTIQGAAADAKAAGDAIGELKSALTKNSLGNLTKSYVLGCGKIIYTINKSFVDKDGVTQSVPNQPNAWRSDFLPINPSNINKLIVHASGTANLLNIMSFYDTNQDYISGVPSAANKYDYESSIPSNAEYVIFSMYGPGGVSIDDAMLYFVPINEKLDSLYTEFNEFINNDGEIDIEIPYSSLVLNKYFYNGDEVTVLNNMAFRSGYIEVGSDAKGYGITSGVLIQQDAISYFDENYNSVGYINGVRTSSEYDTDDYYLAVPEGAKYVVFSAYYGLSHAITEYTMYRHGSKELSERIDAIEAQGGNAVASQVDYVCYGDSITSGAGSTGNNNSYANRLNTYLHFKSFVNHGVSGSGVIQRSNMVRGILYTATNQLSNFKGVITVAIGTNDFLDAEIGDVDTYINAAYNTLHAPSTTYDASYTFSEGFRYTIESLMRANPRAKILILLPINRNNENTPNALGYTLEDYREAERKIALSLGCVVIDTRQCGIPMETNSTYTADGLHPNDFGYDCYAAYMTPIILDACRMITYMQSTES
ncbi:MAG: SGNH/GDSL hydrolase family protein [Methanobrevibacter sp.]|nr:SGNH/GDSL hydrolase family protein [Methanobrevibacter sp.]